MVLLYNTMYLRCATILSILKIVLSCHIDKPEENLARRGGNNPVVNETFTSDKKSTIDDNGTVDEIISPELTRRFLDIPKDEWANREELTEKGRFLKRRQVVTCDGFVLTIFRLTGNVPPTKIPVLLMHGLYQSSDVFVKQSKDQSLAFKLQDLGYDVWLANLRGNKYSRHHMYLDPEEQKNEFFNSTYEEMGIYDLAATVDFILNETGHSQLHYIGYSIGGTVFLVLNSMEPWQNEKFEGAHLMAPIGYQKNFPLINILRSEALKGDLSYDLLVKRGIVELFPYTNENTVFLSDDCLGNHILNAKVICQKLKIKEKMDLKDRNNGIESTRGGSIKQLAHIAQNVRLGLFSRWDYGERENENRYGTKIPPEYILSRVTVPTEIIFAIDDEFVKPRDMIDMAEDLSNGTASAAGRSNFTHEDFLTAPDVSEAVYENVIKDLEMNSNLRKNQETTWISTFCKRYFWPIIIILIIIILILLGFLMAWFFKEKEEKDSGLHVCPPSHKSTQTVESVPATSLPVAHLPSELLPTTTLPAAGATGKGVMGKGLPVTPLPATPLPVADEGLPMTPLPATPLPVADEGLPMTPLPATPLSVADKGLPMTPLPATPLSVADKGLPITPLSATPLPVAGASSKGVAGKGFPVAGTTGKDVAGASGKGVAGKSLPVTSLPAKPLPVAGTTGKCVMGQCLPVTPLRTAPLTVAGATGKCVMGQCLPVTPLRTAPLTVAGATGKGKVGKDLSRKPLPVAPSPAPSLKAPATFPVERIPACKFEY